MHFTGAAQGFSSWFQTSCRRLSEACKFAVGTVFLNGSFIMEPKCGQGNFLTKVHTRRNQPSHLESSAWQESRIWAQRLLVKCEYSFAVSCTLEQQKWTSWRADRRIWASLKSLSQQALGCSGLWCSAGHQVYCNFCPSEELRCRRCHPRQIPYGLVYPRSVFDVESAKRGTRLRLTFLGTSIISDVVIRNEWWLGIVALCFN